MKTPKEYIDNLKKGVITKRMLGDSLYSVNKRAKNCRDQERYYRNRYRNSRYYDHYNTEERYRAQKEQYYMLKEKLLKYATPKCIHRETRTNTERIYSYEPIWEETLKNEVILHRGGYYRRVSDEELADNYENYDNLVYDFGGFKEYIEFVDIEAEPSYSYYLFYEFDGLYSFHTPISNPDDYDLPIVDIDELVTSGKDIGDLISMAFVKKVLNLIDSGNYVLEG